MNKMSVNYMHLNQRTGHEVENILHPTVAFYLVVILLTEAMPQYDLGENCMRMKRGNGKLESLPMH